MQFINLPTALFLLASALSVTAAPIQNEVALETRDPAGATGIKNLISTTIFRPKGKLHARDELEARVWPKIPRPSSPQSPKSPKSPVPGSPRERNHKRDELEARVWPKIPRPSSPQSPKSPKSPVPGSPRERNHKRDELEARVWPKIPRPSSPKSPKSPKPVPGSPRDRNHKRTLPSEYFAKDPNEVEQNFDADGWAA
ncbi:hypothetical protein HYFRA_00003379 [Hymenoscyphus fraxineus]|uniref:Uncharacterized protein n=1 Tax=Hymenoscyphus fraxineus TaxID=746836 RepID=A0A9N9PHK5_9HELO|nr:hypothetical protein HYFRA_00003379 [Hymenoscyphus fraxineus]